MKKVVLFLFASVIVYATFFTEKDRLDREVKRLCAIDGGIKAYETVRLPAERFEKDGSIYIPAKWLVKPADGYYIENSTIHLITGNPELLKLHSWVYRETDKRLLGESISYMRRGGSIPGPWHSPAFYCPQIEDSGYLVKKIFIKE